MDATELRSVQQHLKEAYRDDPDRALVTLRAEGVVGEGVTCSVQTGRALAEAGLHPASGGTGRSLCSGDMLLELTERYCVVLQTIRCSPTVTCEVRRPG